MKSTFKTTDGGTLVIEPSPTRGNVWLRWSHPDLTGSGCIIPIPVRLAAVVAAEIERTGLAIEEGYGQRPELPAPALSPAAEEDARRFAAGIAVCGELQA